MAKSVQNYIDELYSQGKTEADRLKEQRTQADDKLIQQTNAAIDKAAEASVKPYQTQLDELPALYDKLYDANAVQELVNRRQVQETMANMGLTDSGLNRTQQTAIALQRGNADAQVRLSQQQKTQELQDRIDQLLGNSAAQKIQQEADIRNATEKWYSSTLENLRSSAAQQGTSAYNAQMQAQAAEAKAREQAAAQAAQAQQRSFENALSVLSAMEKAGISALDRQNYLNLVIGSGGGSGSLYGAYNTAKRMYSENGEEAMEKYLDGLVNKGILSSSAAIQLYELLASGSGSSASKQTTVPSREDAGMYPAYYYYAMNE